MQNSKIELKTDDGMMPACEARPQQDPKGAIVVVQEAFGLTDHINDVCIRLAEAGWLAVAPALYHRQGSPVLEDYSMDKAMPLMSTLDQRGIDMDIATTFEWLDGQGFESEHQGIVGFCMGGTVSAHVAATYDIGAAVTFYGGGIVEGRFGFAPMLTEAAAFKTPWLGLYGDKDPTIPVDHVEQLRQATIKARVEAEVERFPEAGHGFHCDARPDHFDPASAEVAWARTLAWFSQHIV